jgi:hypothetical protein
MRHVSPFNQFIEESLSSDMLPYPDSVSIQSDVTQPTMPNILNDSANAAQPSNGSLQSLPVATATADLSPNVTKSPPSVTSSNPAATSAPPPVPKPLHAQTVSASRPIPPAESLPAHIRWCQVRLRNVCQQTIAQVSVVITSPDNTELVVSNSGPVLPIHSNRMDFAAIPQIAPQEEVIVTVGISAPDDRSHRLHVQVRDAQGGSNQDIQARWKVAIEPIEKP